MLPNLVFSVKVLRMSGRISCGVRLGQGYQNCNFRTCEFEIILSAKDLLKCGLLEEFDSNLLLPIFFFFAKV